MPRKDRPALVLTGHGLRRQVHQGTLLIQDGFTHYPRARKEYRYFPDDRSLPSRIVVLDGDGAISFDVLQWLAEQAIPLVVLDWQGEVLTVVGGAGAAPDPVLRQTQIAELSNGRGLRLATNLIR